MPQAATAHDTFWDFVSLMPESTHMLMWAMSDRTLPRSFRMMQGFGVHTFRLVNAQGKSTFVKFHWRPVAGTHSLDWDESVKICRRRSRLSPPRSVGGHRGRRVPRVGARLPAVLGEAGRELQLRRARRDQDRSRGARAAHARRAAWCSNRNPDNFFAETEQVAFCAAHIVPGIDFTNDPLLAGRIHSYVDTQISRLGGPNFHEIPINAPVAQVHNNQRDGMHRQAIHRGRVAYEPNSLGGGCPFQAGSGRLHVVPRAHRGRQGARQARAVRRSLHAGDALLEQPDARSRRRTSCAAFASSSPRCRSRRSASASWRCSPTSTRSSPRRSPTSSACRCPKPLPKALKRPNKPEVEMSPALSLFARPGDGSIRTRRIAILVADGVDGEAAQALHDGLDGGRRGPALRRARGSEPSRPTTATRSRSR